MRFFACLSFCVCIFASALQAEPEKAIKDLGPLSPDLFLKMPFDELADVESLSLLKLSGQQKIQTLALVQRLPKLVTLRFDYCDLTSFDAKDTVPAKVTSVIIADGKISQGTIRWLAKFPEGTSLLFGCNVRGLDFNLGKFSWLTFDGCEISRSAVTKLVEKMTQVTFKEVTLVDEK